MKVLYAGGFDLFHHGHVNALKAAREIAGTGQLIVGVNSNRLMRHYKREPRVDEYQRMQDVRRQGIANEIVVWDGPEGQDQHIIDLSPDVYVAGTNWLREDLAAQLGIPHLGWFDDHNVSLMFLRRTQGISTTTLIQRASDRP